MKESCWKPVYKKARSDKGITPEPKGYRGMSKQCKPSFNNVTVLAFSSTVLLMCVRTRHMMRYSKFLKEGTKIPILTTPIRLNMNNFVIQQTLNMCLKLHEDMKHIRFALNQVKPSKATKSINETDIIVVTTNRSLGRPPYI
jgi:hypothetical protein